jgi:16S rRNA U516 pseudouridylate synthase RsuA-like enzyme
LIKDLKRIKYGNIEMGDLSIGSWRYLDKNELNYCKGIIREWDKDGAGWNKHNSNKS